MPPIYFPKTYISKLTTNKTNIMNFLIFFNLFSFNYSFYA